MANKDYISKQEAIDKLWRRNHHEDYEDDVFDEILGIEEEIKSIPAADVAEVVRCKDCEEFYKGKCELVLGLPNPYPDSFCSFGKKQNEPKEREG